MIRSISIFAGTFLAGALIALVTRAALFAPHEGHEGHPVTGGNDAAMVSHAIAPFSPAASPATAARPAASNAHAAHGTAATPAAQPVNTLCAICGMPVDPSLPADQYEGQTIGFGCRMCPPQFKANPDKYGPSYLRNEVYKP